MNKYKNLITKLGILASLSWSLNAFAGTTNQNGWYTTVTVDEMTDKAVAYSLKLSENSNLGYMDDGRGTISIQCSNNKTLVFIDNEKIIPFSSTTPVMFRLDDNSAQTQSWFVAGENNSKVVPKNSIGFAKKLLSTNLLKVKIDGDVSTYDLTGFELALQPIRKNCNW